MLTEFISKISLSLSEITITTDQIVEIIQRYNSKKAHGFDEISVAMLQLCAREVALPLSLIFQKCATSGTLPDSWENANVQPVHKKKDRQLISNYRPISLLPICGKILEKIVFDQVYSFLNVNNFFLKFQSGFRPGDSCIYQLMSITSSIYENFRKI